MTLRAALARDTPVSVEKGAVPPEVRPHVYAPSDPYPFLFIFHKGK